jgi:hypothetical protein
VARSLRRSAWSNRNPPVPKPSTGTARKAAVTRECRDYPRARRLAAFAAFRNVEERCRHANESRDVGPVGFAAGRPHLAISARWLAIASQSLTCARRLVWRSEEDCRMFTSIQVLRCA